MILSIIYRLVKIFGRGPSGQDFFAYFWFFALLEFGNLHVLRQGSSNGTFRATPPPKHLGVWGGGLFFFQIQL